MASVGPCVFGVWSIRERECVCVCLVSIVVCGWLRGPQVGRGGANIGGGAFSQVLQRALSSRDSVFSLGARCACRAVRSREHMPRRLLCTRVCAPPGVAVNVHMCGVRLQRGTRGAARPSPHCSNEASLMLSIRPLGAGSGFCLHAWLHALQPCLLQRPHDCIH